MIAFPQLQSGIRWSWPFAVLLGAVVLLPFGVSLSVGPFDLVHLSVMAVIAATGLARAANGLPPLRWHPCAGWLLLLVALQLVSMTTARDPMVAVRSVFTTVLGVMLALTVHTLCTTPGRWRALLTTLVTVGGAAGIYGMSTISGLEAQFSGAGALSGRADGVFNQPNQLGTFSAITLMISWAQVLGARSRPERWLAVVCGALSGANLLLSFSRGAWLGAGLGAVVLMIVMIRHHRRLFLSVTAALGVVVVPATLLLAPQLSALAVERFASILEPDSNPDDKRPFIFREAYRQIVERPLLGQGPGNFVPASLMAERSSSSIDVFHAHNIVLHVAAEGGLFAVAALAAFALSLSWQSWQMYKSLPGPEGTLGLGLVCALLAVIGQGLVDYTLGNPILFYLLWIVIGGLLAATNRKTSWRCE